MRRHFRSTITAVAAVLLVFVAASWAKEQPPEPEKMKKLSFPSFKEFKTKNKIEVVVIEHHEQPLVTIAAVLKASGVLDPWEKIGLSFFAAELLNKGTKDKTADELATWIESAGGEVGIFTEDDYAYVTVSILTDYLDTAYEYLSDIIMNPVFPEEELEILRKRVKTSLEIELSQPESVANRRFAEIVYGDHPYAKAPTPETVDAITREDLVEFHKRYYMANNALIAVVGDVKTKKAKKSLEKHFGSWKQGKLEEIAYTPAPERTSRQIYLYHRPGAVQTSYRVGHLGLRPKDPDWPAIIVGNRVLGGGADSRLFMNLREEKGWTYGAYSSFSREPDIGAFSTWAAVRTEVTDSALVELVHELDRIVSEPVTEEELDHAKSYLIGNFPTTIETPGQIASQVIQVKLLGLGKKHLETYRDRLAEVTVEDVSRVMKKYLHPDRVAVVLVGDAKEIKEKVEPIADIALFNIEGKPISFESLAIAAAHYDYDAALLKDMTATYAMKMQQMPLGDFEVSLQKKSSSDGGVIEISSKMAGMINLDEAMVFRASDFSPISYKYSLMAGPAAMSSDLHFKGGGFSGMVQGQGEDQPKEVSAEMVEGTILDTAVEYALCVLPIKVNESYRFPVVDTKSGSLQNVDVEVVGEEELSVPAGSFSTFKMKVTSPQGSHYIYCQKEVPHILVKQEVPSQGLIFELKSIVD